MTPHMEADKLNLTPGMEYDYAPFTVREIDGVRLVARHRGERYSVVCTAREGHTMQEMVVYLGVSGKDKGKHYLCSLSDFAVRFIRAAAAEALGEPVASIPYIQAAPDPLASLREHGQQLADRHGEAVLLIPAGAASSITGYASGIPFLSLFSQTEKAHLSLALTRFEPAKKEG